MQKRKEFAAKRVLNFFGFLNLATDFFICLVQGRGVTEKTGELLVGMNAR
jgi:hypothetical protein